MTRWQSSYPKTDDPETTFACPECDCADVVESDSQYYCRGCRTWTDDIVERAKKPHHNGPGKILQELDPEDVLPDGGILVNPRQFQELTLSDNGVKEGVISGDPIVDREYTDDSDEPRDDVADLSAGDTIALCETGVRVMATVSRVEGGLYQLTFDAEVFGTVADLYVDRDPYMLSVCNGSVYAVPTDAIAVGGGD